MWNLGVVKPCLYWSLLAAKGYTTLSLAVLRVVYVGFRYGQVVFILVTGNLPHAGINRFNAVILHSFSAAGWRTLLKDLKPVSLPPEGEAVSTEQTQLQKREHRSSAAEECVFASVACV